MALALCVAVLLSLLVVVGVRIERARVAPRAGAWAIVIAGWALAGAAVGGLVLVASPLPARVPLIASLGRWQPQSIAAESPVPTVASLLAMVVLAWLAVRTLAEVRVTVREWRDLVRAHRALRTSTSAPVVTIDEAEPAAFALSRTLFDPGRIVVTTGLRDLLDPDERAAVLAHERVHLRCGHALFVVAARGMVALNPLLVPLRRDLQFLLERWADEDTARQAPRAVVASALAKVALATSAEPAGVTAPFGLAWRGRHDVALRVGALLDDHAHARRGAVWGLALVVLVAGTALGLAAHDTEHFFEMARLWRS